MAWRHRIGLIGLLALLAGAVLWRLQGSRTRTRAVSGVTLRAAEAALGLGAGAGGGSRGPWFRDEVNTLGFFLKKHPIDMYDQFLFVDLFLSRGRLHMVTREYRNSPADWRGIKFRTADGAGIALTEWHERKEYESCIIGIEGPEVYNPGRSLEVVAEYEGVEQRYTVLATPEPPRTRFAMCAIFRNDKYLLRMWTAYWASLGIGSFYLFFNGAPEELPTIIDSLSDLPAHVVFVRWPYQHWIPDRFDHDHGQPMGINDCLRRWRHLHEFVFFYDLDELLVLPAHKSLGDIVDSWPYPSTAIRTQMAWTQIHLDQLAVTPAELRLKHLAQLPLTRGPVKAGREKYFLNTSSTVQIVNLHGVYTLKTLSMEGKPPPPMSQVMAKHDTLYHVHLWNVGTKNRGASVMGEATERVQETRLQEHVASLTHDAFTASLLSV